MDFDRTSLDDRTLALRARSAKMQESLERPLDDPAPPLRPEHGGATAAERTANETKQDDYAKERRRAAMASLAELVRLPGDSELDIEVDTEQNKVTFLIRDRRTGEVLRQVPDDEAQTLVERLREFSGVLVDRSF
jgi:uncharacterized FlaG/YvyC family protein